MTETDQILKMLEDSQITADEAHKLLLALEPDTGTGELTEAGKEADTPLHQPPPVIPPDMDRFRRLGQIPFAIALGVLIASGWGMYVLYHQADAGITPGFVGVLILFVIATMATALTLWMMRSPWLHVRIVEKGGKRIAISLPLPLTLASWGVSLARRFVDNETAGHLSAAAAFLEMMQDSQSRQDAEPIVVDVDDKGERVQVYLG